MLGSVGHMNSETERLEFIEVPFHCPLPAFCPVCGLPAEGSRRVRAWEGIPLVFTYHVSVSVPYCRAHCAELAALEFRQRLAVWGVFLSPLASVLPALVDWSLRWFFYVGCLSSLICLYFAFCYISQLSNSRGVQMRTLGSWPGYRLRSSRSDWNQMLRNLVDHFTKSHASRA